MTQITRDRLTPSLSPPLLELYESAGTLAGFAGLVIAETMNLPAFSTYLPLVVNDSAEPIKDDFYTKSELFRMNRENLAWSYQTHVTSDD